MQKTANSSACCMVMPLGSPSRRGNFTQILMVMRLTLFFLFIASFAVSAPTASQTVSLSGKNMPLKEVFSAIKKQTGFVVFYKNDLLENTRPVTLTVADVPLADFLATVLLEQPLNFRFVGNTIVLSRKPSSLSILMPPPPVTGTILSSDGTPLEGASIKIKGSSIGTASDAGGRFSIEANPGQVLVITYTGYRDKEITVTDRRVLTVKMEIQNAVMQEVVVGYGSVRKKDITGSVSVIDVEEMQKQGAFSLDVALAGRAAGVMVTKSSGAPGADASIRIRGATSIFGINEPLYVIDGVPVQIGQGLGMEEYRNTKSFQLSPLSSINPEDIESIDILKDASGTAIYGSRGANGVVLVTTRKGKGGAKPTVSLGYNASFDAFVKDFEMLSSEEMVKVATEAYSNNGQTLPADFLQYPETNTDWRNLVTRRSYSDAWNVSLRGGSLDNETIYSFSASTNDQRGVIKGTEFKRYSIRGNVESQIVKMFKLGTNINYTNNNTDGLSNTFYYNIVTYRPDIPVFDPDGRYATSLDSVQGNPVAKTTYIANVKNENLLLSVFGELRPFEFLRIRSTLSYNKTGNTTVNYTPSYDPFEFSNDRKGSRDDIQYDFSSMVFDNTITFNKFIKAHYINAVVGSSFTSDKRNSLNIESVNFPDDFVLNNLGSAGSIQKYVSGGSLSGLESYFFRANYNYDSKYYFTFTARSDKSTKFGPDNQWGFFPSGAFAWRASKEGFLQDKLWLSDLKVRASIGRTGAANLGDFLYSSFFSTAGNGSFYNAQNGVILSSVPNPSLKWETTTQTDFGIDFALFNNRLRGAIDIYRKYTRDLLLNVDIPNETGASSQILNVGDLSNKGLEFVIGGDVVKARDFSYTSDINLSFNRAKLEKLNEGWGTDMEEGDPLGAVFGYQTAGIFQTQAEVIALNEKSPNGFYQASKTSAGDLKFVDQDKDGSISSSDIVKLGNAEPDFYGGWNNVFRYKGLEASLLFYFSYGQLLQNAAKGTLGIYTTDKNYYRTVLDAWSPKNTTTDHPRNVKNDPNRNARSSDYLIQDGSFFKLKNLHIAYYLNAKRFTGGQVSQIKVFAAATNLFILTGYDGVDPEVSTSLSSGLMPGGYDSGAYPSTRTFSIGFNLTL